jgi:hypothetical protein
VTVIGLVSGLAALIVTLFAWLYPDPSKQPSRPEDRASYLARVDAMCAEVNASLVDDFTPPADPEGYAQQMGNIAAAFQGLLVRWAGVDLPRDADEEAVRPVLDSLEAMALAAQEVASWVRMGELLQAEDEYQRLREHGAAFRTSARDYGLVECLALAPR